MGDWTLKWLVVDLILHFFLFSIFSPFFCSVLICAESLNLVCNESSLNNYYLNVMNSAIEWLLSRRREGEKAENIKAMPYDDKAKKLYTST